MHELPRVTRELLADGEEAEVVEDPLGREGHVHHLGEDELEHGQEEPLGGGAHPVVLHGRRPDHGGRIDRVPAARDGGDLDSVSSSTIGMRSSVQHSIRSALQRTSKRSARPFALPVPTPTRNAGSHRPTGVLNHLIIINERHRNSVLREYVDYYNVRRTHQGLVNAAQQVKPSQSIQGRLVDASYSTDSSTIIIGWLPGAGKSRWERISTRYGF